MGLYDKINEFFSNIFWIFEFFYIRCSMKTRPKIEAKNIESIDPLMRLEIWKYNINYY